jgi:hypothetical protein
VVAVAAVLSAVAAADVVVDSAAAFWAVVETSADSLFWGQPLRFLSHSVVATMTMPPLRK